MFPRPKYWLLVAIYTGRLSHRIASQHKQPTANYTAQVVSLLPISKWQDLTCFLVIICVNPNCGQNEWRRPINARTFQQALPRIHYTLHDHQSMHGLAWSGTRLLLSSLMSWGVERVKTRNAEVKTLDRYRTYRAYSVVRYLYTDLARLGPAHMKYRIYLQYEYDQNINKSPVRCLYSTDVLVDPRGFPGATLKVMSGTPIKLHRTCTRTAEARCPAYETQGKYTMEWEIMIQQKIHTGVYRTKGRIYVQSWSNIEPDTICDVLQCTRYKRSTGCIATLYSR